MQLHQIRPIHKPKRKKRIGRGGKHGFTSGSGSKGQKSRAGRKFQPLIRQIIKRYPKLRGHNQEVRLPAGVALINLNDLEKNFASHEKVSPAALLKKRLINKIKGKAPKVKILGSGAITKKLIIEDCEMSKSAEKKIKAAL
ncbi:MAG: uL15 family ribosomal protein [bacterium]